MATVRSKDGVKGLGVVLAKLAELAPKKAKPATDVELAKVEAVLGNVPRELRALYAVAANLDTFGSPDGVELLSPRASASAARAIRKHGAPESVWPLATDHAGNYACFDAAKSTVVDWDHETRKVTRLAPSLEKYLADRIVAPLSLARDDDRRVAEEARTTGKKKNAPSARTDTAPKGTPKKLVALPSAWLTKIDRPNYAGGAYAMAFLSGDRVAVGFTQSLAIFSLGGKEEASVFSATRALAYHAGTERLFAANHGVVALLDAKKGSAGTLLFRNKAEVGHGAVAAFSPDGARVAVGDTAGRVGVFATDATKAPKKPIDPFAASYTLPTKKAVTALEVGGFVESVRFSPDGEVLAVGTSEGELFLFDTSSWKAKHTAKLASAARSLDYSPDGATLYVIGESGKIEAFDTAGKPLRAWATSPRMTSLRVLANGYVATVGEKAAALYEPTKGKLVAKIPSKKGPARAGVADVRGDLFATVASAQIFRAE